MPCTHRFHSIHYAGKHHLARHKPRKILILFTQDHPACHEARNEIHEAINTATGRNFDRKCQFIYRLIILVDISQFTDPLPATGVFAEG